MEHDQAVTLVVGVGCSTGANALEIARLVGACLDGRRASMIAVPASRASLASIIEAACLLGLPVRAIPDAAIEAVQARCLTRPCRAARAVAEGAALAAAGGTGILLGPRAKAARVTCAIARP